MTLTASTGDARRYGGPMHTTAEDVPALDRAGGASDGDAAAQTSAAAPAPLPVSELLCLALHRASRAMTAQYRPLLAPHGLTYPQYLVVSLLHQDGPRTVGGVGEQLGLESSTLSPLLGRLAERGLVLRTRAAEDERRVQVELTDTGHALGEQLECLPDQVCEAAGLSRSEAKGVVAELMELVAVLEGPAQR